MKIDDDMINRIASLAYLRFDEKEREQIRGDLEKILSFVERLNQLQVDEAEPLTYLTGNQQHLRTDRVQHTSGHTEALKNAPASDGSFFLVPKVLKDKNS